MFGFVLFGFLLWMDEAGNGEVSVMLLLVWIKHGCWCFAMFVVALLVW
jgi:hypothetical protein